MFTVRKLTKQDKTDKTSQADATGDPKLDSELGSKRQDVQSVGAGGDREASFNPPALSLAGFEACGICGTELLSTLTPSFFLPQRLRAFRRSDPIWRATWAKKRQILNNPTVLWPFFAAAPAFCAVGAFYKNLLKTPLEPQIAPKNTQIQA